MKVNKLALVIEEDAMSQEKLNLTKSKIVPDVSEGRSGRGRNVMIFDDIYAFFESPPPVFLNAEAATCYALHALLQGDTYAAQLVQNLEQNDSRFRISECVLYQAIEFLEQEKLIIRYEQKLKTAGRPRQMFQLVPEARSQAQELAQLWEQFVTY